MQKPQESPSAPMIEGTKKRSNESETVVFSKKNSRRAPDVTEPDITPDEPFWLSPDRDGYVRPLGCAGPLAIEQDPCFLSYGLRVSVFSAIGLCITAFNDSSAYSVKPNGNSSIEGLRFWLTRVRSHLASGLGEAPEELAFDRHSACFFYDVGQAIERCNDIDRLILWNDLETKAAGFLLVFTDADMELKKMEAAVISLKIKVASARPGALGTQRSRDPNFGKKTVNYHTPK